jgi:hypothetical protein
VGALKAVGTVGAVGGVASLVGAKIFLNPNPKPKILTLTIVVGKILRKKKFSSQTRQKKFVQPGLEL